MLTWKAPRNTRQGPQQTQKKLSSTNKKLVSKFHPWCLTLILCVDLWFWSLTPFPDCLNSSQEEADDDLLCADQCPSWSLDWPQIYRPHVKRGTKGKLVFCNCYHQKVNVEPSHYIIWFEKVKKNTLPILYQYQKSWYWYNFTENLHLILSKNKWIFTGNFQKLLIFFYCLLSQI